MPEHVPHSIRQGPVFALTALTCLIALAPTTVALAQAPDPKPLWKAYPLNPSTSTDTNHVQRVDSAPRTGGRADGDAAPLAVAIAFYGALAGLCALGFRAALVQVRRRRTRPTTSEVSWSPDAQDDAFRATAQSVGEGEWVKAESGRFERRSPEPPEHDAASQASGTPTQTRDG